MIGVPIAKRFARRSYDAINRGDLATTMAGWHPDARFTYPGHLSISGTRQGRPAIEAWFGHFFEAVPTRTFRPLNISVASVTDVTGNNVMAVQWDNRPVNKGGEAFYVRGVTITTIRWGRITNATTYVLDYEVLPRLWGEEEPTEGDRGESGS